MDKHILFLKQRLNHHICRIQDSIQELEIAGALNTLRIILGGVENLRI